MAPGGRGRGGKFGKPTRGGGKKFSRNLRPLDEDGNPIGMWGEPRETKEDSSSEEEEDSSEEESSEEEEDGEKPQLTREERRAAAKAKKEAAIRRKAAKAAAPGDLPPSSSEEESDEDDAPANPNHTASARSQAAKAPLDPAEASAKPGKAKPLNQLSRREREEVLAQQARERYQKLHAEGKTDEARADLARLAIIKEQREAERVRKQAEKEEKEAHDKERLAEQEARENKRREAAAGGKKKVAGKKK